ncbi:MAG: hypothetical protein MUF07_06265 [Steroidobacteraceae bacterium]|jgi:hypothetical protein|nr:hypothetical protein [Steroidobacteraceae bacterium]
MPAADKFTIYGQQQAQVRQRGPATVNGQSASILDVPVELGVTTRYEDAVPPALRSYGPTDLRTGELIEVRGYQPVSGANAVRARIVQRRTSSEPFELRGLPTNVLRRTFAILENSCFALPSSKVPAV